MPGRGHPHRGWACSGTPSTPAWAPVSPSPPGGLAYGWRGPEAGGVPGPRRMEVWAREDGTGLREKGGGGGSARLLAGGALADALWSLVRRARTPPLDRRGGAGSRDVWALGAAGPSLSGRGRAGLVGTRRSGRRGWERLVGWEGTKLNTVSRPGSPPSPSVPLAWGVGVGAGSLHTHLAAPKAEKDRGGSWPGPGAQDAGRNLPGSARLPRAPPDPPPPRQALWPGQRWVGAQFRVWR